MSRHITKKVICSIIFSGLAFQIGAIFLFFAGLGTYFISKNHVITQIRFFKHKTITIEGKIKKVRIVTTNEKNNPTLYQYEFIGTQAGYESINDICYSSTLLTTKNHTNIEFPQGFLNESRIVGTFKDREYQAFLFFIGFIFIGFLIMFWRYKHNKRLLNLLINGTRVKAVFIKKKLANPYSRDTKTYIYTFEYKTKHLGSQELKMTSDNVIIRRGGTGYDLLYFDNDNKIFAKLVITIPSNIYISESDKVFPKGTINSTPKTIFPVLAISFFIFLLAEFTIVFFS